MRQVVLDTETTGLDATDHRIIEIGAIELIDRKLTGRTLHRYLNPERAIDEAAYEVHGISQAFLKDKPRFAEVADELLAFIAGAELVIHNAAFDIEFLDHEFARLMTPTLTAPASQVALLASGVIDSLLLARQKHPGQKNSLDALCRRYAVDASQREHHGALLDAALLAQVYLAMTGGQTSLLLAGENDEGSFDALQGFNSQRVTADRAPLPIIGPSIDEEAAHEALMDRLQRAGGRALWRELAQYA